MSRVKVLNLFSQVSFLTRQAHRLVHSLNKIDCRVSLIASSLHSSQEIKQLNRKHFHRGTTLLVYPVAIYEEIVDLERYPEKVLVDVRLPDEIKEQGSLPRAINIPCESALIR